MMSAVAPNRAVSATVLLMLVVTGGCLAMASAIPVASGRRLQQLAATGSGPLAIRLLALTSGLRELSDQLHILLQQTVALALPVDLQGQLQQVATSFAQAQGQLQSVVNGLLNLQLLGQPEPVIVLRNLLTQIAAELDAVSKQLRNPQPSGGCLFRDLHATLVAAITNLTSQLKLQSNRADLPMMQPVALIAALGDLENAVRLVNPCAPGLEKLVSNGQGVLAATIGELVANIQ